GSALGCIDGCGEFDHVIGAVLGGFVGEAALMPVGVHVGNRGRGDPVGDLLVSIGTATVGVIMVNATTVEESLVIVPIAQLAA
ncbi:MAG: hypothetical protein GWN99_05690, partial [Gemmatimonadetes bacterium]|nr:hypothetical protein [Gemmatimonadota bacterium]NIS00557.1 hypothetical protein [Gemmatimonadota bacterium]NIT66219.1 hypothetical protein [Gemmatimonadota bacterium]NIU54310.1 hypothetical protein [Gemmatimonadota bacterium]NIV22779.1 hypothetical protein [Gemmatimonadota bacterium]